MPEQLSKQLEFDFILNQIKPEPNSFYDYILYYITYKSTHI